MKTNFMSLASRRELSKRRIASEQSARPDLANSIGPKQAQLGNPEAL
jgi:hypothetical protein